MLKLYILIVDDLFIEYLLYVFVTQYFFFIFYILVHLFVCFYKYNYYFIITFQLLSIN